MKVLIYESMCSQKKGGAEKTMINLAEYLTANKIKVFYVYESTDMEPDEILQFCQGFKHLNLTPQGNRFKLGLIKDLVDMRYFIKTNKIDLILTHTIHCIPSLVLLSRLSSVRILFYFKWSPQKPIGNAAKFFLGFVDHVLAVSQFTLDYWSEFLPQNSKTAVIGDGIEFKSIERGRHKKEGLRETAPFRIMFAGRIIPSKGLHLLIKSIASIHECELRLDVFGEFDSDSDYETRVKQIITEGNLANRVFFHGHKRSLHEYFVDAKLVVVPSVAPDAQPLVLLEAMACKTLCIGSKVGGIPEILSGELSELQFQPNVNSLTHLIKFIMRMPGDKIQSLEKTLYSRYLERYHKNHTQRAFLQYLTNVYE